MDNNVVEINNNGLNNMPPSPTETRPGQNQSLLNHCQQRYNAVGHPKWEGEEQRGTTFPACLCSSLSGGSRILVRVLGNLKLTPRHCPHCAGLKYSTLSPLELLPHIHQQYCTYFGQLQWLQKHTYIYC